MRFNAEKKKETLKDLKIFGSKVLKDGQYTHELKNEKKDLMCWSSENRANQA
jgi:hypothetical protein